MIPTKVSNLFWVSYDHLQDRYTS